MSTGTPQGGGLRPVLFVLLTHDCSLRFNTNHILTYANDITVVGLIRDNSRVAYGEEVDHLQHGCRMNSRIVNVNKTKEIIMDF